MALYVVNSTGASTPGGSQIVELQVLDMDLSSATDGSLLYYNAATDNFRADTDVTRTTLTDGGNF